MIMGLPRLGTWEDGFWVQVKELDQNLYFFPVILNVGE